MGSNISIPEVYWQVVNLLVSDIRALYLGKRAQREQRGKEKVKRHEINLEVSKKSFVHCEPITCLLSTNVISSELYIRIPSSTFRSSKHHSFIVILSSALVSSFHFV